MSVTRTVFFDRLDSAWSFSETQKEQFWCYFEEILKWDPHKRLVGYDAETLFSKGIADSLSIAPFIGSETLIDVGSGAGLPGLVLAIAHPEKIIHLVDSNHKKTSFLWHMKAQLGLSQVSIHSDRIESLRSPAACIGITAKAFAPVPRLLSLLEPLRRQSDVTIYAMKGSEYEQEWKEWQQQCPESSWVLQQTVSITVPFLEIPRYLMIFRGDRLTAL